MQFSIARQIIALKVLFFATLAWRFALPILINPTSNLFSDPKRHWLNGGQFLDPNLFNAIDPRLYQLWVWMVRSVSDDKPLFIAISASVLSVLMVWFWYKVGRELFDKRLALGFAILIALMPSLSVIYSYIMNETLLLTLMALSFWLTLRAVRKKTLNAFIVAIFCWILCLLTRYITLPFAALAMAYMLFHLPQKKEAILITCLLSASLFIPSGLYGMNQIHVFAPFGFSGIPNTDYYSGTLRHGYKTNKGDYIFSSPSFYANPLEPFFEYSTYREKSTHYSKIDFSKGMADWDRNLEALKQKMTWQHWWNQKKENAVFLFFGHSWPDSGAEKWPVKSFKKFMLSINYHSRWLSSVLMVFLLLSLPFMRLPEKQLFTLLGAWAVLVLILLINTSGTMEGRYRKPLEPLFLIMPFIYWHSRRLKLDEPEVERYSIIQFVLRFFLEPYLLILKTRLMSWRDTLRKDSGMK